MDDDVFDWGGVKEGGIDGQLRAIGNVLMILWKYSISNRRGNRMSIVSTETPSSTFCHTSVLSSSCSPTV
jgi:hypothetical protein